MSTARLDILCAGAVQGVVKALQQRFAESAGAAVEARFNAVGALKEALVGGEPCDVMIATDAMVAALQASGELLADVRAPLGRVRTGVATRLGDRVPDVSSADALRAALLAAPAICFPDPTRATAGIHFASVLDRLGIRETLAARIRHFPNGATSMRELAAAEPGAIGCTQVTEILYTPGVVLAGPLPEVFGLATVYTAGIASRAASTELARRFVALLASSDTRRLREEGGFEFD